MHHWKVKVCVVTADVPNAKCNDTKLRAGYQSVDSHLASRKCTGVHHTPDIWCVSWLGTACAFKPHRSVLRNINITVYLPQSSWGIGR